ncbi:MAG: polysaccharide deacetylase family protein [Halofilum sp. (in: g-proteobacteria)]|nr:polysaccharide deacetylase family protein [Halofilum sp. (in: g-proteobacteria)]
MIRLSLALLALLAPAVGWAASSGVVLEYHHVAEDTPPSTSVTPATFQRHMDYLADNGFEVWPLPRLIETVRKGGEVPDRTVAITFDDGYRSVYREVFPRLQKRGWPFTIFITTGYLDGGDRNFVTWDQLREMEAAGRHDRQPHRQPSAHDPAARGRERVPVAAAHAARDHGCPGAPGAGTR